MFQLGRGREGGHYREVSGGACLPRGVFVFFVVLLIDLLIYSHLIPSPPEPLTTVNNCQVSHRQSSSVSQSVNGPSISLQSVGLSSPVRRSEVPVSGINGGDWGLHILSGEGG